MATAATAILPPGPKQLMPLGNLVSLRRNPIQFLTKVAKEHGDVAYFKLGSQPVFLLNNPDHIRDVLITHNKQFMKGEGLQRAKRLLGEGLLTSEGEFHLRQRRLAQPAFHRARIAGYGATMVEYAQRQSADWQHGEERDIAREMMHLTLGIAGKTLFDADVATEADEIGAALSDAMKLFNYLTLPFSQFLERLPIPAMKRFRQARERLDETIYRIIRQRRESGEDRGDLLSMLIQARDTEGDGSGMTDEQLRDEAMTIFLAGHETTANALAWTWYLLSQNPEAEAKFHAEVDAVLGKRTATAEDFPRLRYTEMVFAESMRVYPPAWIIGRRALTDYQIGGYQVPARSIILMSQYVAHHNPKYFPDPERFDPERWTPEARESRPKFSYFPFGGGPRLCIGEHFAWMEGVLVMATLAQRWQMRLAPGHPVELEPIVTLRPKYGMRMRLERR
ncbi:MAG TPA: cytochrome P450 [Blastocatellia bacterium]|nr:cytochrome P450 [Blastocatellia bacterium]HMV82620.1 cytochrome P450 [Blastocatellia bacterium]HMX24686.1 cytochrome P450 [Blastocatellia bacterium]HMY74097.1 cytochrome P450 [Blastocatellia bacterium]HMZ22590.1 cytochrome P450 [Blastocatellia bacterium]